MVGKSSLKSPKLHIASGFGFSELVFEKEKECDPSFNSFIQISSLALIFLYSGFFYDPNIEMKDG